MFGTDDDLEREHKILRNLENSIVRGVIITPISEGRRRDIAAAPAV